MSTYAKQPELHVEVSLKMSQELTDTGMKDIAIKAELEESVARWLKTSFGGLSVGQEIDCKDSHTVFGNVIEHIYVGDYIGPETPDPHHALGELKLCVHVYVLHDPESSRPDDVLLRGRVAQDRLPQTLLRLPNKSLAKTWAGLKFDNLNPVHVLRSVARIITLLKQPNLMLESLCLNRLVLFHGPPGCGKTTLSRALAQKLTIRLDDHFTDGVLYEINTQTLLSKYYSESGRLIGQIFDKVTELAKRKTILVCVLIDEVESIAASREQMTESGECYDSVRATNQLLTALDRIRDYPNIIIFCTSNMKQAIDPAFLDRVDYEVSISSPCESAVYEILRTTFNDLMRAGLIVPSPVEVPEDLVWKDDRIYICDYDTSLLLMGYPGCPAQVVARLARTCKGYSGRKLKKLPVLAITTYTWGDTCSLNEALEAIEKAVQNDLGKDAQ